MTHDPSSPDARAGRDELDAVWLALEEGRLDDAMDAALALGRHYPEDGEVALAQGAVAYETGLVRDTLDHATRAGELGVEDAPLQQWYVAAALHYMWRFDEARERLDTLLRDEPQFGEGWYLQAQVCEMQEDEVGARRGYDRARELQPDRFHRPTRITDEQMMDAVEEARNDLPAHFQRALDEIAVVVEDAPSWDLARAEASQGDPLPPDLLGLFVGSSRLDKSVFDIADQPGLIFLFQRNLERICPDPETLIEEIRTTLYHELAHYLGFEEEDMAELGLQ